MPNALVWFRHDLRLDDNPALQAALDEGFTPLPVYVHAPAEEGEWVPGAASQAWLGRSLASLDASLRQRGSRLLIRHGHSRRTLQDLIDASGATAVFWNRKY
jgi:deoxyribodipyrimidine photo-lyase